MSLNTSTFLSFVKLLTVTRKCSYTVINKSLLLAISPSEGFFYELINLRGTYWLPFKRVLLQKNIARSPKLVLCVEYNS